MNKLLATTVCITSFAAILAGCSTSGKIYSDDREVIAYGGKRPDWVGDTNNQSQKKMRDIFSDKQDEPKYYYVVSQANVDNEDLVTNCYEFADANSGTALAYSLNKDVTGAKTTAGDASSSAHYAESIVKTKGTLVGSETLGRHWEKTRKKSKEEGVTCWVATGIPMKNFEKAKGLLEKKLEAKSGTDMEKRAKKQVQESVDESKNAEE